MEESNPTPNRNHIDVYPAFNVFLEKRNGRKKLSRKESKLDRFQRVGWLTTTTTRESTASHKKDFELVMFATDKENRFSLETSNVCFHKGRLKGRCEEKSEKGSSTRMVSVSVCAENIKEPELANS